MRREMLRAGEMRGREPWGAYRKLLGGGGAGLGVHGSHSGGGGARCPAGGGARFRAVIKHGGREGEAADHRSIPLYCCGNKITIVPLHYRNHRMLFSFSDSQSCPCSWITCNYSPCYVWLLHISRLYCSFGLCLVAREDPGGIPAISPCRRTTSL